MSFRFLVCVVAALALAGCGDRHGRPPAIAADVPLITCVNPASGFVWTVRLDRRHNRADTWPARFGSKVIHWSDESDGGLYDLYPQTGELDVTHASSTGGYLMFDRCRAGTGAPP